MNLDRAWMHMIDRQRMVKTMVELTAYYMLPPQIPLRHLCVRCVIEGGVEYCSGPVFPLCDPENYVIEAVIPRMRGGYLRIGRNEILTTVPSHHFVPSWQFKAAGIDRFDSCKRCIVGHDAWLSKHSTEGSAR